MEEKGAIDQAYKNGGTLDAIKDAIKDQFKDMADSGNSPLMKSLVDIIKKTLGEMQK